ncbi:helix-turn-helix domain-containing protein [Pantoea vagans]|uniref:Helix-turn-helix domain-containing protein n=1 Tax=Pantoea vagans TaxID=470934 RepID=A0ABY3LIN0_9GAMM|nr:helix-turn-helix domain-containing protein [Pantoea vagans]
MPYKIGERIKLKREELGLSQADLAKLCGWPTASRLGNYESGSRRVSAEDATLLAEILKVTPAYLLFGEAGTVIRDSFNYPTLSAEQLLNSENLTEEKLKNLPSPIKAGERAFWFEVVGHSMTSPFGMKPSFPEGMMVLCDPDQKPKPGNFCLVRLNQENEISLKKLSKEDGVIWLEPLNSSSRYKPLPLSESIEIVGKIITASWPTAYLD